MAPNPAETDKTNNQTPHGGRVEYETEETTNRQDPRSRTAETPEMKAAISNSQDFFMGVCMGRECGSAKNEEVFKFII